MLARRIVAKHVTKTTALAMLGATAVLSVLQVLFTYLGELGALNENYNAWQALLYVMWGAPRYLYEILPIAALMEQYLVWAPWHPIANWLSCAQSGLACGVLWVGSFVLL